MLPPHVEVFVHDCIATGDEEVSLELASVLQAASDGGMTVAFIFSPKPDHVIVVTYKEKSPPAEAEGQRKRKQ